MVTVVAVLLLVQAGFGVLNSGMLFSLAPSVVPTSADLTGIQEADELLSWYRLLVPLAGLLIIAARVGLMFNLALLVGAVGLLRRKRWAWYMVIIMHALWAGALFLFLPNAFGGIVALAVPGASMLLPWLLALAAVLPALALIVFLLLGPVMRQFEPGRRPGAVPA